MDKKSQLRLLYSLIITSLFSLFLIYSFAGGDGSIGSPYQISDCTELQNMSSCLSCNYTLINDVDCNGFDYGDGKGFMPVGNCTGSCWSDGDDYPFTGNFNGQNNEISNLFINRSGKDNVGLFGVINGYNIINFTLNNVKVLGNNSVGAIAGINYNYYNGIDNIYVNGYISGNDNVGGIVGMSVGFKNNSYSSATVSGNKYVGGAFGTNWNTYVNTENIYSTGDVYGNDSVGGLVGRNDGSLKNSYSTGDVYGNYNVGGLIGLQGNGAQLLNVFTTSQLNGTSLNYGGLIGHYTNGFINNSWYYNYSGNINHSFGTGSTIGVNTISSSSYFYNSSNEPMASWDLINDWNFTDDGFPQLNWAYIPPTPQSPSSGISSIFPFGNIFILISIFAGIFLFN